MSDSPNLANSPYVDRVNRAIDHIHANLDESLRLEDVARVAAFSPYHFHRIFKSLVGETLQVFVKRVRLERAVYLLSHRDSPSLTEVALACGFSSSSDFSRSFKQRYGVAPRDFDLESFRLGQREAMQRSLPESERDLLRRLPAGENPDGFVANVVSLPARRVAYLRVQRPFEPNRVTNGAARLVDWATSRGLADGQWLGYMWQDAEIVELQNCLYDVGVEVPDDTRADGDVCIVDFPAMQVAEINVAGAIDVEQRAIDWVYQTWLPRSGFVPDHQPFFEAWNGLPFAHGVEHFELRLQLPIVSSDTPP